MRGFVWVGTNEEKKWGSKMRKKKCACPPQRGKKPFYGSSDTAKKKKTPAIGLPVVNRLVAQKSPGGGKGLGAVLIITREGSLSCKLRGYQKSQSIRTT